MTKPTSLIAPSLLSADFARLGEDAQEVLKAGADVLHFDVMDNHFVPNLTIGPMVLASLRRYGIKAPIDVHLMINPVNALIPAFAKAGADYISFHIESSENIEETIALIKSHDIKAGLALNPDSDISTIEPYLNQLDLLLVMSVFPGFGGQKFIPESLDKIKQARDLIDKTGKEIRLEVDGGINLDNINDVFTAGADMFVAGSAVFNTDNYQDTILAMRNLVS